MKFIVNPDGSIELIHKDDVNQMFDNPTVVDIKRASHVEPTIKDGKVSWFSDMTPVNGPVLGPFDNREEALKEEVTWLENNYLI